MKTACKRYYKVMSDVPLCADHYTKVREGLARDYASERMAHWVVGTRLLLSEDQTYDLAQ